MLVILKKEGEMLKRSPTYGAKPSVPKKKKKHLATRTCFQLQACSHMFAARRSITRNIPEEPRKRQHSCPDGPNICCPWSKAESPRSAAADRSVRKGFSGANARTKATRQRVCWTVHTAHGTTNSAASQLRNPLRADSKRAS
jgi:hypothetical protein